MHSRLRLGLRVALLSLVLAGGAGAADSPTVKAAKFKEFVDSAGAKMKANDYAGAIADYDRAAALEPKIDVLFQMRAEAKEKLKDWRGVIADYSRAIELKPHESHYYDRAMAKIEVGDLDGALADFDQGIRLNPQHAPSYRGRALVYEKKEDWGRAASEVNRAFEANPKYQSASLYAYRARLLAKKGDWPAAIADYDRALQLEPKLIAAYRGRAEARQKTNDDAGAQADEAKADELQTAVK